MTKKYAESELPNGKEKNERWVRLPTKPGERLQGISRPSLYNWIEAGHIKSASIRQPGKLTGIRVIWLPSLLEFIEKHVETGGIK
jgi:hypothetical protein